MNNVIIIQYIKQVTISIKNCFVHDDWRSHFKTVSLVLSQTN